MLFPATLAGSLPKPSWLAETNKLWPQWRAQGEQLAEAKRDATLLWLKLQEALRRAAPSLAKAVG